MAWAQIVVEINRVERNCMPQHGWHTNSSYAGLAAEPTREVILLCHRSGAGVQCKESMGIISAPSWRQ